MHKSFHSITQIDNNFIITSILTPSINMYLAS